MDQLPGLSQHGAALSRPRHRDPPAAPKFEQTFVAKQPKRPQHGVGVDSQHRREVARRWYALARQRLSFRDGPPDLGRDLLVERHGFGPVDRSREVDLLRDVEPVAVVAAIASVADSRLALDTNNDTNKSSTIIATRLEESGDQAEASPSPEALIEEARARQRRRRRLIFCVLVLAVAGSVIGWLGSSGGRSHAGPKAHGRPGSRSVPGGDGISAVVPERPESLVVGPDGNLFIADDASDRIVERLDNGTFSIVAGDGKAGFSGDGGPAVDAKLDNPGGMAFGAGGTLYFADQGNGRVRAVSPQGVIYTVAGDGSRAGNGYVADGTPALDAAFAPNDVAIGPRGRLCMTTFAQVLCLQPNGTLDYVVGGDDPGQGVSGDGLGGPAANASSEGAEGLAFDSAGDLYFFGFEDKTWLVVTPDGTITAPAGTQDIYPRGPGGFATAPDGDVWVMSELKVEMLTPTGVEQSFDFPATASTSFHGVRGFSPDGIAIGRDGTIYVDTFDGNGFAEKTAIAAIDPSTGASKILWEAP